MRQLCRFSVVHGSFAKKEAGLVSRAEAAETDAAEWRGRASEAERQLAEAQAAAASARECASRAAAYILQARVWPATPPLSPCLSGGQDLS